MSKKAMSLKSRIKNYAKSNNITAQVVLQNYMFERFLERLSKSTYKDKFVVKGGILIASIVGLDTRSTMDLDTTIRNLSLTKDNIVETITEIISINLDDDVIFSIKSVEPIRKDDVYGGYCVKMNAEYETIVTPISIDVSTGDVVTPEPIEYELNCIFDDDVKIKIWGYNIETVLAEKIETILTRGELTSRPRDYYDVYILVTTQQFDKNIFTDALKATAQHRKSTEKIKDIQSIITEIENSDILGNLWLKYQKQFSYAKDIAYEDTIKVIKSLVN